MTACADCTRAAQRSHWGFRDGCRGCKARGIGRLPQYREAAQLRDSRHRPYVLLLEQEGLTHEEVREAVQADKEHEAMRERRRQARRSEEGAA